MAMTPRRNMAASCLLMGLQIQALNTHCPLGAGVAPVAVRRNTDHASPRVGSVNLFRTRPPLVLSALCHAPCAMRHEASSAWETPPSDPSGSA